MSDEVAPQTQTVEGQNDEEAPLVTPWQLLVSLGQYRRDTEQFVHARSWYIPREQRDCVSGIERFCARNIPIVIFVVSSALTARLRAQSADDRSDSEWNWLSKQVSKRGVLIVISFFMFTISTCIFLPCAVRSYVWSRETQPSQSGTRTRQQESLEVVIGNTAIEIEAVNRAIEIEAGDPDTQCVVCLEPLCQGQVCRVLPCSHRFHATCVNDWLQQHFSCPVCRQDIRPQDEINAITSDTPPSEHEVSRRIHAMFPAIFKRIYALGFILIVLDQVYPWTMDQVILVSVPALTLLMYLEWAFD